MPKDASSFELTLSGRPNRGAITRWLYGELRRAIVDGRLGPGTRLPSTRDFANQYGVSRGTAVSVFEQLQAEGYIRCRTGAGAWVNEHLQGEDSRRTRPVTAPSVVRPEPLAGLASAGPARPFRMYEPAIREFPAHIWMRLARRRLRAFSSWLRAEYDACGYTPLREAIAGYLRSSRGVNCRADQIVIVSGVQQALDLVARLLLRPGDPVWMEDPGYFGAAMAFRNAGARVVPVPLDDDGLSVAAGVQLCSRARAAYLTPAHHCPLGTTMSLDRRLALLDWASRAGAFVIEDDYDSEYRFERRPIPALQGLDADANVIFTGTFNKVLFPWLRLGYVVLPHTLIEPFLALRYGSELRCAGLDQAVLCDFIVEGHLGRHIRRMRTLYAARLDALQEGGRRYLKGLVEISGVKAGLYSTAFLRNGMTSLQAESAATAAGIETMGLHRFTLNQPDLRGLVLGFAAFDERAIRNGLARLARALEAG